jgi:hypothetical protein
MYLHNSDLLARFAKTLRPSEQLVFLDWLKQDEASSYNKRIADYFIAHFSQLVGKRDEAIRVYTEVVNTSERQAHRQFGDSGCCGVEAAAKAKVE